MIWLPWVLILGILSLVAKSVARHSHMRAKSSSSRWKCQHDLIHKAVLVIQVWQLWDATVDLVYPSQAHHHWVLLAHGCLFSDTPSLFLTWLVPYMALAGLILFAALWSPFFKFSEGLAKDLEISDEEEREITRSTVFLRELACSLVLFQACFQIWLLRSVAQGFECAAWSESHGLAWDSTCGDAVLWVPATTIAFVLHVVVPLVCLSYLSRITKRTAGNNHSVLLHCAAGSVPHVPWWTCRLISNTAVVFGLAMSSFAGPRGPQRIGLIWAQCVLILEIVILVRALRWDRGRAVSAEAIMRVALLIGMQVLARAPADVGPWSAPLIALITFGAWGLYIFVQRCVFVMRVKHGRVKVQQMAQQLSQMALYLMAVEQKEFSDFCAALSPEERWRVHIASQLVTKRLLSAESEKDLALGSGRSSRRGSMDSLSEQWAEQVALEADPMKGELSNGSKPSNSSLITNNTTNSHPREAEDWVPPLPALDGPGSEKKDEGSMKKWVLDHLVPASANPNEGQRSRDNVENMPLGASATSPWMSPRGSSENMIQNPPKRLSAENLIRSPHQSAEHILKAPPALLFADIARRRAFSEQNIIKNQPRFFGSGMRNSKEATQGGDIQKSQRHTMDSCIAGPAPPFIFAPGTVFSPSDLVTIMSSGGSSSKGSDPKSTETKQSPFQSTEKSSDSSQTLEKEKPAVSAGSAADSQPSPGKTRPKKSCDATLKKSGDVKKSPRRRSTGEADPPRNFGAPGKTGGEVPRYNSAPDRLGEASEAMAFDSLFAMVISKDSTCRHRIGELDEGSNKTSESSNSGNSSGFGSNSGISVSGSVQGGAPPDNEASPSSETTPCTTTSACESKAVAQSQDENRIHTDVAATGAAGGAASAADRSSASGSSDPVASEMPLMAQQSQWLNQEPALVPPNQNSTEIDEEIAQKKADWEKWRQRKAEREARKKKKTDTRKKREQLDSDGNSSSVSSVCSAASKFSSLSMASELSGPAWHYSQRIPQTSHHSLFNDTSCGATQVRRWS